jgi:hypothetical protein
VAVRADEHALAQLGLIRDQRLAARDRHAERLLRRIDVMEVQVQIAAGVAADDARASGLSEQRFANSPVPACDRVGHASAAPPTSDLPFAVQAELGFAVPATHSQNPLDIGGAWPSLPLD